jgi:hypothetical protein
MFLCVCLVCQVPEFRVSMSMETDKFDALYKRLKPHGVTMTALLAKAVGAALAKHPVMFACKLNTPQHSCCRHQHHGSVSRHQPRS